MSAAGEKSGPKSLVIESDSAYDASMSSNENLTSEGLSTDRSQKPDQTTEPPHVSSTAEQTGIAGEEEPLAKEDDDESQKKEACVEEEPVAAQKQAADGGEVREDKESADDEEGGGGSPAKEPVETEKEATNAEREVVATQEEATPADEEEKKTDGDSSSQREDDIERTEEEPQPEAVDASADGSKTDPASAEKQAEGDGEEKDEEGTAVQPEVPAEGEEKEAGDQAVTELSGPLEDALGVTAEKSEEGTLVKQDEGIAGQDASHSIEKPDKSADDKSEAESDEKQGSNITELGEPTTRTADEPTSEISQENEQEEPTASGDDGGHGQPESHPNVTGAADESETVLAEKSDESAPPEQQPDEKTAAAMEAAEIPEDQQEKDLSKAEDGIESHEQTPVEESGSDGEEDDASDNKESVEHQPSAQTAEEGSALAEKVTEEATATSKEHGTSDQQTDKLSGKPSDNSTKESGKTGDQAELTGAVDAEPTPAITDVGVSEYSPETGPPGEGETMSEPTATITDVGVSEYSPEADPPREGETTSEKGDSQADGAEATTAPAAGSQPDSAEPTTAPDGDKGASTAQSSEGEQPGEDQPAESASEKKESSASESGMTPEALSAQEHSVPNDSTPARDSATSGSPGSPEQAVDSSTEETPPPKESVEAGKSMPVDGNAPPEPTIVNTDAQQSAQDTAPDDVKSTEKESGEGAQGGDSSVAAEPLAEGTAEAGNPPEDTKATGDAVIDKEGSAESAKAESCESVEGGDHNAAVVTLTEAAVEAQKPLGDSNIAEDAAIVDKEGSAHDTSMEGDRSGDGSLPGDDVNKAEATTSGEDDGHTQTRSVAGEHLEASQSGTENKETDMDGHGSEQDYQKKATAQEEEATAGLSPAVVTIEETNEHKSSVPKEADFPPGDVSSDLVSPDHVPHISLPSEEQQAEKKTLSTHLSVDGADKVGATAFESVPLLLPSPDGEGLRWKDASLSGSPSTQITPTSMHFPQSSDGIFSDEPPDSADYVSVSASGEIDTSHLPSTLAFLLANQSVAAKLCGFGLTTSQVWLGAQFTVAMSERKWPLLLDPHGTSVALLRRFLDSHLDVECDASVR